MEREPVPEEVPESIQLPLVWLESEESILAANQFLLQLERDLFILSIGQLTPPAVLGTPQERYDQIKDLPFAPVKTVGRFGFTRERLGELIDLLDRMAKVFDEQGPKE